MSFEDVGLDLAGGAVGGHSKKAVWDKGICVCGHRVAAHATVADRVECRGVSKGSRLYRTQMLTDCSCRLLTPVVLVQDTRPFRTTWRSALPDHPLNAALGRVGPEAVIDWLIPVPLVCWKCERVGGVRAVYAPGTRREVLAMLCGDCAPDENGM